MGTFVDVTGQRFGNLTVLRRCQSNKRGDAKWLCRCECGKKREVIGKNLRLGLTRSCGCLQRSVARKLGRAMGKRFGGENSRKRTTHGHSCNDQRSPTYRSWQTMKSRCGNPNNNRWKYYGGRGIKVCDRWLESFENFLADMGERPPRRTLDRIDPDGDYEPGNCRWATNKEQRANRRDCAA